ncbi:hypothetical protein H4J51_09400 [Colwellia sp. MB02u-18]|uniref:hypothetical protein n=1 Tax=unclassified Colwellia TaxID=196834 RepID=UPI0015F707C7|nr:MULTISPECIES: hypothetical protein [unclassified Colwellia]MBA6225366.1 hypothetical protein [Colwellia sp. MB3u-45]MBA6267184.1 hypothetical protein [Colwellia sp. MB3u-43]MBA6297120.1 hypothetical protein [Colwellia sp. MB02u-9]MBA6322796.1 hypothetical protein [Colwellia sp. MB02u-19]MBA6324796.1 hypothetical protein [Colwellia sp. MB02u-18]
MFAGVAFLAIIFQLAIVVGIIVFAVKLLNRITDIAGSQKSIAESQVQLISLLSKKQSTQEPADN